MKPLNVADDAPWKQRYRAPSIKMTQVAKLNKERGTAVSNESGLIQVYAWDVLTGEKRQITHREEGVMGHSLSPDGRFVYYLEDEKGDEIGHYVRIPWEGGTAEIVTPTLPPYSPAGLSFSHNGEKMALITAMPDGFTLYILDINGDEIGEPRKIYHCPAMVGSPVFSADGATVVVETAEKSERFEFALYAFDTTTGEKIGELWDGAGATVQVVTFSPLAEDGRVLALSNKTGVEQLLFWHPQTGQRQDLTFDNVVGATYGYDWSEDGQQIVLSAFNQAVQQWFLYDVVAETITPLDAPSGTISTVYFMPNNEIFGHLQDSEHPMQLVALDAQTGQQKRVVLSAGGCACWASMALGAIQLL